jgi:hypothetical protein
MKTIIRSLFLLTLAITLSSSAIVDLPGHIKTVIIIDRTLTPDKKQNKIEEVLTGEVFKQDEQAVIQVIEGLVYSVSNSDRLTIIRTTEKFIGENSGKLFPQVLTWADVSKLCDKYKADAAIVLETFDSDYFLTHGSKVIPRTSSGLPGLSFYAQGIATVDMGFRIYDPSEEVITDAYLFHHEIRFDAGGNSLADAIQGVLNKTEAIKRVGYDAGVIYGQRITPSNYTVTRYFYDKPKKNKKLSEGVRRSKVADWKGAIQSWEEAMTIAKKDKHKGRIALNIAVAYEVLGDLDKALDWAEKSYVDYEEKMADNYVRQLKVRINETKVVEQQMKDTD